MVDGARIVVITDYVMIMNVYLVLKNHLLLMKNLYIGVRKIQKTQEIFSNHLILNIGLIALIVIIHLIAR